MKGEKRNNAVGVKGKSGRKKLTDESIRAAVINKSWAILLDYLDLPTDNQLFEAEKRKIALEIAKKTIPQKLEGDFNGSIVLKWQDK